VLIWIAMHKAAERLLFVHVQLGKMRYASVNVFKGRKLIDIREYYENADGEMKPGRKGWFDVLIVLFKSIRRVAVMLTILVKSIGNTNTNIFQMILFCTHSAVLCVCLLTQWFSIM